MLSQLEQEWYLEKINEVLSNGMHPIYQQFVLGRLTNQYLENGISISEDQLYFFAEAMHQAEITVRRRINN